MRHKEIRVDAFAKLTLSLRVLGTRADGYHEIDALTASVSEPYDSIVVALSDGVEVRVVVDGPFAGEVPGGESNLAARAARLLRPDGGVVINLHKRIPPGGGLGGGSADAAAVLVGLKTLTGVDLDDEGLAALGATLGSDVPFCVRGGGAYMRGRGEVLEPVSVPSIPVLVATPPFGLSTPAVYRAWDELGGPRSERAVESPPALAQVAGALVNDLEPAAEHVEPRLRGFRESVESAAGRPALLAGSGSSVAVLFEHHTDAAHAYTRVGGVVRGHVWVGGTTPSGVVLA